MVTIKDVAKAAGVSPMTVSHVINEHPHVRESTRAKVVAAMDSLGYRVNVAARNLRAGRTFTIGLAVPEVDRPYWGQFAAHVIDAAADHNLRVLIEQTGAHREGEIAALSLSRKRMYDGLILSTVGLGPADADILRVDYPVVILGERIFDGPVDHVGMDNVAGGELATRHLLESGCRRVVLVTGPLTEESDVSSLRRQGYLRAHAALGMEPPAELALTVQQFTMECGRAVIGQLVADGVAFDGVFCITDTIALGVLRGLRDAGVTVPNDVKVVGFDNIDEAAYAVPSLTTVDPDRPAMARRAVDLLVDRISERGTRHDHVEATSRVRLVQRESTAL